MKLWITDTKEVAGLHKLDHGILPCIKVVYKNGITEKVRYNSDIKRDMEFDFWTEKTLTHGNN